jgi:gliding motility-associated-like protein
MMEILNKRTYKGISAGIPFLLSIFSLFGQLQVTGGHTATQLADKVAGYGVVIMNAQLTLPLNNAAGMFDGTASNIGLGEGVLLTSGTIFNAIGPNNQPGVTATGNTINNNPILDTIAGTNINDLCILEFDVIPSCDTIGIRYVFASDEYPEFTCSINDAFGFFVSGPGLSGTQNIAIVPGTNLPVIIDNIHDGTNPGGFCPAQNPQFYVNNGDGSNPAANTSVQYDGFTVPLLAKIPVLPCNTYHIILAIGDASDDILDSGVFIEEGGISCTSPPVSFGAATTAQSNSRITVEECLDGVFSFKRIGDMNVPLTITFEFHGSAIMGTDYLSLPNSITFPVGVDSVGFIMHPLEDAVTEGPESVILVLNDTICGFPIQDSVILIIQDRPEADFSSNENCPDMPVSFTDLSDFPTYNLIGWEWDFGDGTVSSLQNPQHSFSQSGNQPVTLIVEGEFGCFDTITKPASVFYNPVPRFDFTLACVPSPTFFSDNSTVQGSEVIAWNWDFGDNSNSTLQNPSHTFSGPGIYPVSLKVRSAQGCSAELVTGVEAEQLPIIPEPIHALVCPGYPAIVRAKSLEEIKIEWFTDSLSNDPFMVGRIYKTSPLYMDSTYYVRAVNHLGCPSKKIPVFASVFSLPTVEPKISSNRVEIPNAIVEFGIDPVSFPSISEFLWDFGDETQSEQASPVHQYKEAGTYEVILTVVDSNGCRQVLSSENVFVNEFLNLSVPSAFSPNGDGLNDAFEIGSHLVEDFQIDIFDRWGRMIFSSKDLNFTWKGTDLSGFPLPEGVYVYNIRARRFDHQEIGKKGYITLIR